MPHSRHISWPRRLCAATTPSRAGCLSKRPAKCLMFRLSPRRGLSSSHMATRNEKRLGSVTLEEAEVTEGDTERNFIKHCRADRKARHSTPFFARVKSKRTRHARARASAWDNPQKLWITQWTTALQVAESRMGRGPQSN
ncbi:hypothetical protein EMIT048CA2_280083 [Pseudomonas chlororaphis]